MKRTGVYALLKELCRHHLGPFLIILATMIISNLAQGLSIALLSPLLSFLGTQGPTTSGRLATYVGTMLAYLGLHLTLRTVLLTFLAVASLENLIKYIQLAYTRRFIGHFVALMRIQLFATFLHASWPYWSKKQIGQMMNRLTTDSIRVESAMHNLMMSVSDGLLLIVLFTVSFLFSWQLSSIFLVGGGLMILLMESPLLRQQAIGHEISDQHSRVQQIMQEQLNAAKLIKSSGLITESIQLFDQAVKRVHQLEMDDTVNNYRRTVLLNPLFIAILCLGFYIAVIHLHVPTAKALVILFIFFRLSTRITGLQQMAHMILSNAPSYVLMEEDRLEAEKASEGLASEPSSTPKPVASFREIALKNITYSYRGDASALDNIDIRIPVSKTIAIVGISGSGKTTLLDILVGLLVPQKGAVMIDDRPLTHNDLLLWRREVGYVGQDPVLFDDTIANNIRWAYPEASEAQMRQAATLAQAHGFISDLPNGYDTRVGHRGVQLSGGERQRIALARALVRRPQLLILDEATSALDAHSETQVQKAIDSLQRQMTIVIVTHRLATTRNADYLYVLDKGHLVQQGGWSELAGRAGPFQNMWRLQGGELRHGAA